MAGAPLKAAGPSCPLCSPDPGIAALLAPRCASCGAELRPLADLAARATDLAERAGQARSALATMRLALPAALTEGVRSLAVELPELAARLACASGTCRRRSEAAR